MSANLVRRVLVAAIGIPTAATVVYLGGWVLAGFVALLAVAGTAEVYRLAEQAQVRAVRGMGYLAAAACPLWAEAVLGAHIAGTTRWAAVIVALWGLVVMGATVVRRSPQDRPLEAAAVTLFGAAYAGGLLTFLLALRHAHAAPSAWGATAVVFLPLAVVWLCDTAAMAAGFGIGGPKLAPVLSPKKTWAGAIAGTAAASIVAPLWGHFVLAPLGIDLGAGFLVAFGLVVAVVGQSGDIAESLLKRQVGVKDSGGFFPGHGGVLDRLDSLYWVLPVATGALALAGVL